MGRNGRSPAAAPPGEQLAHVALFADGEENAGDKVLPEAVRSCFTADTGPDRWHQQHAHLLVDEAALEGLNARRAVVVGGGGLFLPDTAPNGNSGWQWNIPDDVLARITAPLAVFAVGYNVFDGQRYRRERFAASLRALVERSAFFGLRNHGSVARVRELLPESLREKVRYQPCPTTVARHLDPRLAEPAAREDTVLVNCAYDRAGLRFGHDYGHFLAEMAAAIRAVSTSAEVRYAAHMPADERFVDDLRREHGLTLPVEPLYLLSNDAIRDLYRRTRLVIGMRGHAGMIPFGCGTPSSAWSRTPSWPTSWPTSTGPTGASPSTSAPSGTGSRNGPARFWTTTRRRWPTSTTGSACCGRRPATTSPGCVNSPACRTRSAIRARAPWSPRPGPPPRATSPAPGTVRDARPHPAHPLRTMSTTPPAPAPAPTVPETPRPVREHRYDIDLIRLLCSVGVIGLHAGSAFVNAVGRTASQGPAPTGPG